jgi:hypothetical protein
MTIIGLLIVLVLIAVLSGIQKARLRLDGRCEVCAQQMPICETCGRCFDPSCNGGCIYCREDLPFGRRLRSMAERKQA